MSSIEKEIFEAKIEGQQQMLEKAGEVGERVEQAAEAAYSVVEGATVKSYKTVEKSVVGAFGKVEDKFVGKFLTHEGETVGEAKERLATEQAQREAEAEARHHIPVGDIGKASVEASREMARSSVEASKNAGKR